MFITSSPTKRNLVATILSILFHLKKEKAPLPLATWGSPPPGQTLSPRVLCLDPSSHLSGPILPDQAAHTQPYFSCPIWTDTPQSGPSPARTPPDPMPGFPTQKLSTSCLGLDTPCRGTVPSAAQVLTLRSVLPVYRAASQPHTAPTAHIHTHSQAVLPPRSSPCPAL